ncbi:hypothetical protein DUI87_30416 [Hirundo rustica rustica]|uniref:Uncharacterized protein n=1 Tax=Hirundo rustica rustica TaxID=333673 RepID=A0A3M0JEF1_HIRRU|nr:hypothetical protein DUI87_30416 [Hirundo rustica rustica]
MGTVRVVERLDMRPKVPWAEPQRGPLRGDSALGPRQESPAAGWELLGRAQRNWSPSGAGLGELECSPGEGKDAGRAQSPLQGVKGAPGELERDWGHLELLPKSRGSKISGTETEISTRTDTSTETETDTRTETGTRSGTGTGTETETKPGTRTGAGTKTDTKSDTGTGTGNALEPAPAAGALQDCLQDCGQNRDREHARTETKSGTGNQHRDWNCSGTETEIGTGSTPGPRPAPPPLLMTRVGQGWDAYATAAQTGHRRGGGPDDFAAAQPQSREPRLTGVQ